MGHQIIEFWMLSWVNLIFSFKVHKNIWISIVFFLVFFYFWVVMWIFFWKHCLGGSIKFVNECVPKLYFSNFEKTIYGWVYIWMYIWALLQAGNRNPKKPLLSILLSRKSLSQLKKWKNPLWKSSLSEKLDAWAILCIYMQLKYPE